jgi:hypothetical protein
VKDARPQPYATLRRRGATLQFFLGDCLDCLPALAQASVDVVVTSPPYNLGIKYRTYEDTVPRADYLQWTGRWVEAVARVVSADGSLFLNVGAKPKDPWVAMDIAQAVRPHLHLQNTIHWVKSIVIDRNAAGDAAGLLRDLAVGHYKPINSQRFVNDCHEFIFQFTRSGEVPLDRTAIVWAGSRFVVSEGAFDDVEDLLRDAAALFGDPARVHPFEPATLRSVLTGIDVVRAGAWLRRTSAGGLPRTTP